jgi:hypothetical protein
MIAKINGILEEVVGGSALVRTEGGLTYEVLLSSHAAARLGASLGKPVSLHTLDFIESQGQGTTMTPRLAGFLNTADPLAGREQFEEAAIVGIQESRQTRRHRGALALALDEVERVQ